MNSSSLLLRRGSVVGGLAIFLALTSACSNGGSDTKAVKKAQTSTSSSSIVPTSVNSTTLPTAPSSAPWSRPYAVATHTVSLVDRSRPTSAPSADIDEPERTLETDLYIPEGTGPHPFIVFSHGFNGSPKNFSLLLESWARAGYVVAAPRFPLTSNARGPLTGVLNDYPNQPGDVRFVIDEVLRLNGTKGVLKGKIDANRIGVAGQSLGGLTTLGVTFNSCCRDPRIKVTIVMAAPRLPFLGGEYDLSGVPFLAIHGTSDPLVPYLLGKATYNAMATPKYLLTLEKAGHLEAYTNTASSYDDVVTVASIDFWDIYLGSDPDAAQRLRSDGNVSGVSRLDVAP